MPVMLNQTPYFGSLDAAPWVNLAAHLGEAYRNNNQEAKLRQQIRQEIQQPAQDRFVPNFSPAAIPPVIRQSSPVVRFGMLGMAVWNPLSGRTNDAGYSTFVSNGGTPESLTLTAKEIDYVKAKQEWKNVKDSSSVSEQEKTRLKQRKQELKAGAKLSKERKERINLLLSCGASVIPGPVGTVLGFVTKPVAIAVVDEVENDNCTIM